VRNLKPCPFCGGQVTEIANILMANIDPEFMKILIADKINESEK
jgi:hypothetical protein